MYSNKNNRYPPADGEHWDQSGEVFLLCSLSFATYLVHNYLWFAFKWPTRSLRLIYTLDVYMYAELEWLVYKLTASRFHFDG